MLAMFLAGLLILTSVAVAAHVVMPLPQVGARRAARDMAACKQALANIRDRLKRGLLSDEEADEARLALLVPAPALRWAGGKRLQGNAAMVAVAASVFLLVAGLGTATSSRREAPEATGSTHANLDMRAHDTSSHDEPVANLKDYVSTIGSETAHSSAEGSNPLADVNTMVDRLAKRLETTPDDLDGWRLLAWSYFQMQRYPQSVAAFARAVALDPSSDDLKLAYEQAKEKAAQMASAPAE